MDLDLMGRPKKQRAEGQVPKRLSVASTPAWMDWLKRLGEHCRLKGADVIDQAVTEYAKARGFDEPPPPRT